LQRKFLEFQFYSIYTCFDISEHPVYAGKADWLHWAHCS